MTDGPECGSTCTACGRPLRDPWSRARGFGPKCAAELGIVLPRRPRTARPAPAEPDQHHPGQTAIPIQLAI